MCGDPACAQVSTEPSLLNHTVPARLPGGVAVGSVPVAVESDGDGDVQAGLEGAAAAAASVAGSVLGQGLEPDLLFGLATDEPLPADPLVAGLPVGRQTRAKQSRLQNLFQSRDDGEAGSALLQ